MVVGVIVFGAVCLAFLIGAAIYECVRDKDGEILTDYAHGRIAATALGAIVIWAFSLFIVFTATAVCLAPQFPGRSVYSVALDLAFNFKLYASEPIWTTPALAATGLAFIPFLMAAIFGLPMFRNIYAGYNGDYCDDEADAPEDESFCCICAPCKRCCGRTASKYRAAAADTAASFAAPGTAAAPAPLPPQPRKFSSPGVMIDYCFTACLLHFCGTCLYRMSAPISENSVELWPWWTSYACAFIAMVIGSLALSHKLELMEIPSERARNDRRQRWRTRHGFYSAPEFQQMLEDEFGFVESCETAVPSSKSKGAKPPVEMVPMSQVESKEPAKKEEKPKVEEEKDTSTSSSYYGGSSHSSSQSSSYIESVSGKSSRSGSGTSESKSSNSASGSDSGSRSASGSESASESDTESGSGSESGSESGSGSASGSNNDSTSYSTGSYESGESSEESGEK